MLVCLLVIFQNGNLKVEARDNINLERKKIKTVSVEETRFKDQYHSSAPGVTSFFDYKGNYNVACMNNKTLYIYRYNKNMKLSSTLKIKRVMKFFGNIICDDKGNYYVCWGTADNDYKNTNVINITKYNYSGKKTLSFTVGVKEIGLSAERRSGQSADIHLDVPWNTDSMEIQYSKYKDFPEGNTDSSTYYGGYSFRLTINGLEPGAKYYVRARACQVVDGKEYYSKYSTCTIKAE